MTGHDEQALFAMIYDAAGGEMLNFVDLEAVTADESGTHRDFDRALDGLVARGLVDTPETGATALLTEEGILAHEAQVAESGQGGSQLAYGRMQERWAMLGLLHARSGGRPGVVVEDVSELGFGPERLNTVASLLAYQGLIQQHGFVYALTPDGVAAWERSSAQPRSRI